MSKNLNVPATTINMTIGDGVMLQLDTYNKMLQQSLQQASIIADTIRTISIEDKEPSSYNKLKFQMRANLVLSPVIIREIAGAVVDAILKGPDEYLMSMVEDDRHYLDVASMELLSYYSKNGHDNVIDLMDIGTFRQAWVSAMKRHKDTIAEQEEN